MAINVVTISTGVTGAGKSYVRGPRFLIDEFLRDGDGLFITNIPLNPEVCAEMAARKHLKRGESFEELRDLYLCRIVVIPDDEWSLWMEDVSLVEPWLLKQGLEGAYIVLDEAHQVCGNTIRGRDAAVFRNYVNTLRKHHANIELITQDEGNIHYTLRKSAERKFHIVNADSERVPFLGFRIHDFGELWAGVRRLVWGNRYSGFQAVSIRREYSKPDGVGRWEIVDNVVFRRLPEYFRAYDSHGGRTDGTRDEKPVAIFEHQKRSFGSLLGWFLRRNGFGLVLCLVAALTLGWLLLGGGLVRVVGMFQEYVSSSMTKGIGGAVEAPLAVKESGAVDSKPVPKLPVVDVDALKLDVDALGRRIVSLEKERDGERDKRVAVEREALKLRDAVAAFELERLEQSEAVLLEPGAVVFRSGERVEVGGRIRHGLFAGGTVQAVDLSFGEYVVDGRLLVVSRMRPGGKGRASGSDGGLGGPLQGVGSFASDGVGRAVGAVARD